MDKKLPPPPKVEPPLVTPGWNDPPDIPASGPVAPKRLLNKRVPFPFTPTQAPPSSSIELDEIVHNIAPAVNHIAENSSIKKDMERIAINWKDVCGNDNIKQLLLQASRYIKDGDIDKAQDIHKQLSAIPAAGWFTLFLHSIIVQLNNLIKK